MERLDLSPGLFVFIPEVKLCEFFGGGRNEKHRHTPQPLRPQHVVLVFVSVVVGVGHNSTISNQSSAELMLISHINIGSG